MMASLDWRDGATARLTIGGLSLECAMWGPPPAEAPTIFLLHEGLGCVALWRDFPEQLAAATGCGVFAWSRAGYGASDPKPLPWSLDYMEDEARDCVPQVLDAVGPQQVILLGHSDGATISALYAGGTEDRRLWGVILMAPHFFTEPGGLASIADARTAYDTADLRDRLGKYHSKVDNCFRGWNDSWLHPDFQEWNVSDCLDYIRVPVLAIQGHDDQYGTMAQIDEVVDRCYAPVDVLAIADCRHAPHMDAPRTVLDGIADFCRRLADINV
jgi:pimeloyl-ACP methyl ester carboxylesterase|tara:strand:+ start:1551 stop:2363 length:813 start_codon:yes stop_codon:yes gene_type:complete